MASQHWTSKMLIQCARGHGTLLSFQPWLWNSSARWKAQNFVIDGSFWLSIAHLSLCHTSFHGGTMQTQPERSVPLGPWLPVAQGSRSQAVVLPAHLTLRSCPHLCPTGCRREAAGAACKRGDVLCLSPAYRFLLSQRITGELRVRQNVAVCIEVCACPYPIFSSSTAGILKALVARNIPTTNSVLGRKEALFYRQKFFLDWKLWYSIILFWTHSHFDHDLRHS